jgi:hypothetical protein
MARTAGGRNRLEHISHSFRRRPVVSGELTIYGVIRTAQLKARPVGIVAALFKKGVKPPFITAVTRNPRNAVDP